jgi:hypothetical protein
MSIGILLGLTLAAFRPGRRFCAAIVAWAVKPRNGPKRRSLLQTVLGGSGPSIAMNRIVLFKDHCHSVVRLRQAIQRFKAAKFGWMPRGGLGASSQRPFYRLLVLMKKVQALRICSRGLFPGICGI